MKNSLRKYADDILAVAIFTAATMFLAVASSDGYSILKTMMLIVVAVMLFTTAIAMWLHPKTESENQDV